MATPTNYADLVVQAEQAVAGVNDPELKRIAFQKVLEDLLAAPARAADLPAATPTKRGAARRRKAASTSGPRGYIQELIDEGVFKKPQTITNVKALLENRGHHIPLTSLSGPLQAMCQKKLLRRQKIKASGNKQAYAYSNW